MKSKRIVSKETNMKELSAVNVTKNAKEVEEIEDKPEVVCLCGSTRFYETFEEQNFRLTLEGKIVLSVGCNIKLGKGLNITAEQKEMLDALHKRKIDLADRVLILNVGGYIGDSTKSEMAYAKEKGKPVDYLYAIGTNGDCCAEI
jgi:hypothetical protein